MKFLLTLCLPILSVFVSYAQFSSFATLRTTANFNVILKGLGRNEIGAGLGVDVSLLSKNRLQAIIETSTDHFIGSKLLYIDSATGKHGKNAANFSIKAGPQFFVTRNIALSATYGPVWQVFHDIRYTMDYGMKYSVTGFFGANRRFISKLFLTDIHDHSGRTQYLGLAAGMKF